MSGPSHGGVCLLASAVLLVACSGTTPSPEPSGPATASTSACPPTGLSVGPQARLVVVVVTASASAAAGASIPVSTDIVVLSGNSRIVLQPGGSSLEVYQGRTIVARTSAATGAGVPTDLTAGRTLRVDTVPRQMSLTGCDGRALASGDYRLRAIVAYSLPDENGATDTSSESYVLTSEASDLIIP